jgi:hypothetical protein
MLLRQHHEASELIDVARLGAGGVCGLEVRDVIGL